MVANLSRRNFLKGTLALAGIGATIGGVEAAQKAWDLYEQHRTWAEAARPNPEFIARHAESLSRLRLGASFAPEQWRLNERGDREARAALEYAVKELGLKQMRLGIRWNRGIDDNGNIDLRAYDPFIDYCLNNDVDICLNVGPIKTFRWPEEHVPNQVLNAMPWLPPAEGWVRLGDPIANAALDYTDKLLLEIKRSYGDSFAAIQVENEPFYPLGRHLWRMSPRYLQTVADRVDEAFPAADVLVTSAGRLHLHDVRDLFLRLLSSHDGYTGRLISGFDFHYKTPMRDAVPVIRHFDQISYARPFAPSTEENIRNARAIGYRIEITEGQAEPYGQFTRPGNSAQDFRFLVLRCLDRVLDPHTTSLLRIWGVEELAKRMLRREATEEHLQIVDLIQHVTSQPAV